MSQGLKYSEWRPIGVCDSAPSGIQKAQMFSREDFLIITGPDVNRDNWQNNPKVMRILDKYCQKLAKQSSLARAMQKPVVDRISLVGAIMGLRITPNLNRESEDGKLQLFQVEFVDKGKTKSKKKKKTPWLLITAILLTIILAVLVFLLLTSSTKKSTTYRNRRLSTPTFTRSYCQDSPGSSRYRTELDEVRNVMQYRINDLISEGSLLTNPQCNEKQLSTGAGETRFLKCYGTLKNYGVLNKVAREDLKHINDCKVSICERINRSTAACR